MMPLIDTRKVDVRLPGKRNSNSHGARPVYLIVIIVTMIKWIRTSRLSIKNSLSAAVVRTISRRACLGCEKKSFMWT